MSKKECSQCMFFEQTDIYSAYGRCHREAQYPPGYKQAVIDGFCKLFERGTYKEFLKSIGMEVKTDGKVN